MGLIENVLKEIENYLNNPGYDHEFSTWLEDYIYENTDCLFNENEKVARYLNDIVMDTCEMTEPNIYGAQHPEFREKLKGNLEKMQEIYAT